MKEKDDFRDVLERIFECVCVTSLLSAEDKKKRGREVSLEVCWVIQAYIEV